MSKNINKLLIVMMIIVISMAFTACGDAQEDSAANLDPDAVVTLDKYYELKEADWGNMSFEEMQGFLGVRGVVDEERTAEWGDGYLVVDFPGPDENSSLHVLYSQDDDGEWGSSSMSTTGVLAE